MVFFSLFHVIVLIHLLKYETIEAYAHTFLSHIILTGLRDWPNSLDCTDLN
jgi:hypothetical protein